MTGWSVEDTECYHDWKVTIAQEDALVDQLRAELELEVTLDGIPRMPLPGNHSVFAFTCTHITLRRMQRTVVVANNLARVLQRGRGSSNPRFGVLPSGYCQCRAAMACIFIPY